MIINDTKCGIKIDLTDITCCEISLISKNRAELLSIKGVLELLIRTSSLDGGTPLAFEVDEKQKNNESYLLIRGNLINAITMLHEIERIYQDTQNRILETLGEETISQINQKISVPIKANFFAKINAIFINNTPPSLRKISGVYRQSTLV